MFNVCYANFSSVGTSKATPRLDHVICFHGGFLPLIVCILYLCVCVCVCVCVYIYLYIYLIL